MARIRSRGGLMSDGPPSVEAANHIPFLEE